MLEVIRQFLRGRGEGFVPSSALGPSDERQAAELSPLAPPKVRAKQQSIPSYITNTRQSGNTDLPRADRALANTDTITLRSGADTRVVLRDLVAANPDLSASVFAYLRTAITAEYTLVGRNMDGSFNREATILAQQMATRFDEVKDYSDGFSGIPSLRSTSESLGKEMLTYGAMGVELVLDKARLPRAIVPVSMTQIVMRQDGEMLKPIQKIGAEERDLDIPTFFMVSLDQNLLQPYPESPLEASIQAVLADLDFFNDLRRIVKRAMHPRLDVKINHEKFKATIPQEAQLDPDKLKAYVASVIADVNTKVNDLAPEDALVHFDFIEFGYLNHGNASPAAEEETLLNIVQSRLASGAKTMPSVLGHGGGTQNAASTETLLFATSASGAIQFKLNELFSNVFTLGVRLFGLDAYVEFRYAPVDLRPANELEAFKAMKQSRILEQLSFGFITDDEASIELTGNVTPAGFSPLSGTRFRDNVGPAQVDDAPFSTTGSAGSKEGAAGQARKPTTPTKPKS